MFKHHRPILIADHDEEYTTLMADVFRLEGYVPNALYRLSDVPTLVSQQEFELLILTVDLSYPEDVALCDELLKEVNVPVLFQNTGAITPERFNSGRNTARPKATNAKDLLTAVSQVFSEQDPLTVKNQPPLGVGPLVIHQKTAVVTLNGTPIHLTSTEYALLELLARKLDKPVKKDDLYQKGLGRNRQPYDRSVDVHISAIRTKLKGQDRVQIKSVRGVGYKLTVIN